MCRGRSECVKKANQSERRSARRDQIFAGQIVEGDQQACRDDTDGAHPQTGEVGVEDAAGDGAEPKECADGMAGQHAECAAGQRPMCGDLPIAPAVDDVVEAHAKAVEPDGDAGDAEHRRVEVGIAKQRGAVRVGEPGNNSAAQ